MLINLVLYTTDAQWNVVMQPVTIHPVMFSYLVTVGN